MGGGESLTSLPSLNAPCLPSLGGPGRRGERGEKGKGNGRIFAKKRKGKQFSKVDFYRMSGPKTYYKLVNSETRGGTEG